MINRSKLSSRPGGGFWVEYLGFNLQKCYISYPIYYFQSNLIDMKPYFIIFCIQNITFKVIILI